MRIDDIEPGFTYHVTAALSEKPGQAENYEVKEEKLLDFLTDPKYHVYWVSRRNHLGAISESGTAQEFLQRLNPCSE